MDHGPQAGSMHRLDLNPFEIADAEFEQRGIAVQIAIGIGLRGAGRSALALQLVDGQDIERHGIAAEAKLV